jgi:hypothetical protein
MTEQVSKIAQLEDELREARAALAVREQLLPRAGLYWRPPSGNAPEDGPFCPRCYDGNGKVVRLTYLDSKTPYCVVCERTAPVDRRDRPPQIASS